MSYSPTASREAKDADPAENFSTFYMIYRNWIESSRKILKKLLPIRRLTPKQQQ